MRWQGQCPDCAEWNTLVQEAAEVTSIFAAKHNLRGGGRTIELVGLDHPAALPERRMGMNFSGLAAPVKIWPVMIACS